MCEVTTVMMVAGFALSAVSTVVGTMQQQQAAQAQYEAEVAYQQQLYAQQKAFYEAQTASIQQSYQAQQETISEQISQINAQTVDQMSLAARNALKEQARVRVAAGESGLGGITMTRLENEPLFNLGTDIASLEANRASAVKQAQLRAKGIQADTQGQLNTVYSQASQRLPRPSYNGPSWLGAGLTIAGQSLNTAGKITSYQDNKDLMAKTYGVK
jgi:hypothetical protein